MNKNEGYFSVELTIIITIILITIITVFLMFTKVVPKLDYTIDESEYEKAFSLKIKEIRMQKIMRELK